MRKDQSADHAYPAGSNLLASWSRTESAGELELEQFSCKARFDLDALTGSIERTRFRDSST